MATAPVGRQHLRAEQAITWAFQWTTSWEEAWTPAFVDRWEALVRDSPTAHVFFHPAPVRAWVESVGRILDLEPRFLVARSDTGSTVFLPLVSARTGWKDLWWRMLGPVGYMGFDYRDPVLDGPDTRVLWSSFWPAFEDELLHRWGGTFDACSIRGIRRRCLPADVAWSGRHEVEVGPSRPINGYVAPCADLSGTRSIDEFLRQRSPNLRGDLGRRLRRMEELGRVTFHVYGPDDIEGARGAVEAMLQQHARRWPMKWTLRPYYDALVDRCMPAGLLHLSELRIGGSAVSWHLGFVHRDRFYYYVPAFRADYGACSPGKVHLRMCVADAIDRGLATFDFLCGDEPYKVQWCDGQTEVFGMSWASAGALSRARTGWAVRVKPSLAWLRRRLRNQLKALRPGR